MGKFIRYFDAFLETLSRWGLVAGLLIILSLAVSSIILRWAGLSPLWIEPLIRHLVFLTAFLGGSLATSKGVHIKVDIMSKLIEASSSKVLQVFHKNLIVIFCLITSLGLLRASLDFYLMESEFGAPAFLGIHSSFLVAIIPFGVGLISLRFLNQLLLGIFSRRVV